MPTLSDGRYILSTGAVYAIIWTFTAVAAITTTLRLYTRTFIVKALGLDDALILFGQLACLAISALQHWHVHWVWRNYELVEDFTIIRNPDKMFNALDVGFKAGIITDNCYVLVLPIIKCSILAFYRRISPSKKHHYLLYAIAAAMIIQALVNFFVGLFSLDPVSAWLNHFSEPNHRFVYSFEPLQTINSGFQVLFDLIILALPIPIIYKTKFNRRDRVGLMVIYILSFGSLAATIVRLVVVTRFTNVSDQLGIIEHRINYAYWAIIEIMTVIICANLPAMPALIRRGRRDLSTVSPSSSRYGNIVGRTFSLKASRHRTRNWFHSFPSSLPLSFFNISNKSRYTGNESVSQSNFADEKGGPGSNSNTYAREEVIDIDLTPKESS